MTPQQQSSVLAIFHSVLAILLSFAIVLFQVQPSIEVVTGVSIFIIILASWFFVD